MGLFPAAVIIVIGAQLDEFCSYLPIGGHLRDVVENLSRLVTNGDEFGQIAEGGPTTIQ